MMQIVKCFQHKKQTKKNKEEIFKTKGYTQQNAMPVGQVTMLLSTARRKTT